MLLKYLLMFTVWVSSSLAFAETTWRAGLGGGFGGAGIDKQVEREEDVVEVIKRSEGPGTVHFFLERLVKDHWVLSFEHTRGFRMGPFSSGVGFTSGALLWHYLSPAPDVQKLQKTSSLFVRNWSPYTGLSVGIAEGSISRENDLVPNISSSGVFMGLRNGVDYLLQPNLGLRIELHAAATLMQSAQAPARMSLLSIWAGVYIPAF